MYLYLYLFLYIHISLFSFIYFFCKDLNLKSPKHKIAIYISTEPPPTGALAGWETGLSREARRPEHRSGYLQRKRPPLNTFAEMNVER